MTNLMQINDLIQKYSNLYSLQTAFFDTNKNLLAYSSPFLLQFGNASIDDFQSGTVCRFKNDIDDQLLFLCKKELIVHNTSYGILVVISKNKNSLMLALQAIAIACENCIAMNPESDAAEQTDYNYSAQSFLIKELLSEHPNHLLISNYISSLDLADNRIRAAICIQLTLRTNQYFNINLNLGYSNPLEKTNQEILSTIRLSKYLNSKDIVSFLSANEIIIVKSFFKCSDFSKIYLAMDTICTDLVKDLNNTSLIEAKISYGNFYENILDIKNSYKDATKLIRIGKIEKPELSFYKIDDLFIDTICTSLSSQIIEKMVLPLIQRLKSEYSTSFGDHLLCYETFINCCMNFTEASKILGIHRNTINNRLQRLKELTFLDPISSFSDALLLKFAVLYAKQHQML